MAWGPVGMPVTLLPREDRVQPLDEVLLASCAQFHQRQAGGGMGKRHVYEPVVFSLDERLDLFGEVDNLRFAPGVEVDVMDLHRGEV